MQEPPIQPGGATVSSPSQTGRSESYGQGSQLSEYTGPDQSESSSDPVNWKSSGSSSLPNYTRWVVEQINQNTSDPNACKEMFDCATWYPKPPATLIADALKNLVTYDPDPARHWGNTSLIPGYYAHSTESVYSCGPAIRRAFFYATCSSSPRPSELCLPVPDPARTHTGRLPFILPKMRTVVKMMRNQGRRVLTSRKRQTAIYNMS
jgi:hypothetical protein